MANAKKTSRASSIPKTFAEEHLFSDHSRSLRMGLYWRLPEFKIEQDVLTDEQCERLQRCLGKPLSKEARASIAAMTCRLVEHELITVRAPSREGVLEEVNKIHDCAFYCAIALDELQSDFNINALVDAPVRFKMRDVRKSNETVMTAREAATDLIGGAIRQPLSSAAVWDLIEVCRELKERHSRKQKGNEAHPYFTLFLFCLLNVAKKCGEKTTLPRKDAFGSAGSQRSTSFLDFVFEAIKVMSEIAPRLLDQPTISPSERKETLKTIEAEYSNLERSRILLRLTDVRNGKVPGLSEFVAAATASPANTARSGSTQGRSKTKSPKRKPANPLI